MEDANLLDPGSSSDLYALHFVALNVVQEHLDAFRQGWMHHSLRTEKNLSPMQLWIMGHDMDEMDCDSSAVIAGICQVYKYKYTVSSSSINYYFSLLKWNPDSGSIDWDGPVNSDEGTVLLDDLPRLLTAEQRHALQTELSSQPQVPAGTTAEELIIRNFTVVKLFFPYKCFVVVYILLL